MVLIMNPELLKLGAFGLIAWGIYQLLGKRSPVSTQASLVSSSAIPTTTVKPTSSSGSSNATTAAIQSRLNTAGASPPLVVDGILGPKTTAAIKAFQSSHGITPDGIAGPITQAALGMGGAASVQPITSYEQIPLITPTFVPHE
jgi:peptidoglycan hydrolase-like protein with peptidoglycan-binding domain